jgi:hypothetical protein
MTLLHIQLSYEILGLGEIEHNGQSHTISTNAKIIYSYIAGFKNNNKQAFPSMGGMSKTLNLGSEQVIRREVKNLINMGLLSIVERPGNSHLYEALPLPPQRQQEATQEPEQVQDVQTPAPAAKAPTIDYSDDDDIIPELMHGFTAPLRSLHLGKTITPLRTTAAQNDALEEAKRRIANNTTPLRTYTKQECEEPF